jgi:hypothetical protein
VDVIQRKIRVIGANLRYGSLGGRARERGVGPLAEVHVVVLRVERPRSLYSVVKTDADIEAARLEWRSCSGVLRMCSQMVGALVLSRAVAEPAPALADEVLESSRRNLLAHFRKS